ncbi:MAG: hypothetical protein CM15mP103_11080 [Gammaproteobacteria bacterium]|nr:MAG: hypothetical protein CM15mP103_11080 [Gammaproteobacteria bacterium]
MGEPSGEPPKQLNVLGLPIELCCQRPGNRILSRWALPHRANGSWPAHSLCTDDG